MYEVRSPLYPAKPERYGDLSSTNPALWLDRPGWCAGDRLPETRMLGLFLMESFQKRMSKAVILFCEQ